MLNIAELITDAELLDFSQNFGVQRNYMGSRLFPDQKTQHILAEYTRLTENGNLPMTASFHAFDTEAEIASRVPFEKVNVEELLIKRKINLSERLRRLTGGMNLERDATRRYAFDDVARMAESVVTRAECAKMEVVSTGKLAIDGNGLKMTIDYKVPDDQRVTTDWTSADADILGDIETWRQVAIGKGQTPTTAITTNKVLNYIRANKAVQKAIFGANGLGILPTRDQIASLFASQFDGMTIQTNEQRYGIMGTASGEVSISQGRMFPEDVFVMVALGADGTLGTGLWGATPEEEGNYDERHAQQFVTVVKWTDNDPVATWTKASGVFVPVMPNVYGHIIANVATKKAVDNTNQQQGAGNGEG